VGWRFERSVMSAFCYVVRRLSGGWMVGRPGNEVEGSMLLARLIKDSGWMEVGHDRLE
jgi:hypothetical protein